MTSFWSHDPTVQPESHTLRLSPPPPMRGITSTGSHDHQADLTPDSMLEHLGQYPARPPALPILPESGGWDLDALDEAHSLLVTWECSSKLDEGEEGKNAPDMEIPDDTGGNASPDRAHRSFLAQIGIGVDEGEKFFIGTTCSDTNGEWKVRTGNNVTANQTHLFSAHAMHRSDNPLTAFDFHSPSNLGTPLLSVWVSGRPIYPTSNSRMYLHRGTSFKIGVSRKADSTGAPSGQLRSYFERHEIGGQCSDGIRRQLACSTLVNGVQYKTAEQPTFPGEEPYICHIW